ncbi:MAG: hypothetical protein KAJ10_16260, partial [Thermodesulfovibrionia bacterium]|nr:hypothetical protein [Thermodesulfovibrionia bacterium]
MASRKKSNPKTIQLNPNLSISEKNHEDLRQYLIARLEFGDQQRKNQIDKFTIIDRELAGYLIREQEDDERARDNRLGYGPKPVDNNWGLVVAQLDEAVTFLITVLAPDEGIYNAVAPVDKQAIAKGLSVLMNKHAEQYNHYPELVRGIFNALKYNFAPWLVEWEQTMGSKVNNNVQTNMAEVSENEVIFEGNSHNALDPYNFIYDISVAPDKLPTDGEFFATIDMVTEFRIKQEAAKQRIFGLERFIKTNMGKVWYEEKPEIRGEGFTSRETNWVSLLQMTPGNRSMGKGFEKVTMRCWVPAAKFGLATKKRGTTVAQIPMQIWQFTMMGDKHIVFAEELKNAHGMLPCVITTPVDDGLFPDSKSHAETLIPAQQFSSYQLNVHQRAQRKALIGLTIFNERVLPMLKDPAIDLVGGKIGASGL